MDNEIYDYWVATLQDGYIGNLIGIVVPYIIDFEQQSSILSYEESHCR